MKTTGNREVAVAGEVGASRSHQWSLLLPLISPLLSLVLLLLQKGGHRDRRHHVLTYQDKDKDWMMVGDIPWNMFLENVRRLTIWKPGRC